MCKLNQIENQWIVPGQEPIVDEEMEHDCYEKFQENGLLHREMTCDLLYLQNFNELLRSLPSQLESILNQIKQITRLPVRDVKLEEVNDLTNKVCFFKENLPNPRANRESEMRKAKIISEVTTERIRNEGSTWDERLQKLNDEIQNLREQIIRETRSQHWFMAKYKYIQQSSVPLLRKFQNFKSEMDFI